MSRALPWLAFTDGMNVETVSTGEAARLLGVTERTIRNRIASDELPGVSMVGGCWRIPVRSLRRSDSAAPMNENRTEQPPPYVRRLVAKLDSFETGTVPCADAAEIAGVGVKAMRNGLRTGRIPGGRLVGGAWLVTVAEFGRWLGVREVS